MTAGRSCLSQQKGIVIRMSVDDISIIGRNTSGVKLMNIDQESDIKVASIAKCARALQKKAMFLTKSSTMRIVLSQKTWVQGMPIQRTGKRRRKNKEQPQLICRQTRMNILKRLS